MTGARVTAVFRQFAGAGHFPIFYDATAKKQWTAFLEAVVKGRPVVVPLPSSRASARVRPLRPWGAQSRTLLATMHACCDRERPTSVTLAPPEGRRVSLFASQARRAWEQECRLCPGVR